MAKLSANGRTELARFSKETEIPLKNEGSTLDNLIDWEKVSVALMSDGRILKQRQVRFRDDQRKHNYGWKLYLRFKEDQRDPDAMLKRFESAFTAKGFSKE